MSNSADSDKGSIQSTPRSANSNRNDSNGLDIKHQSGLMKLVEGELEMHVWQQEPDLVASMISPKIYGDNRTPNCLIDNPAVETKLAAVDMVPSLASFAGWTAAKNEREYYKPIAGFLNFCIAKCNVIYDELLESKTPLTPFTLRDRKDRVLPDPFVVPFDKPMSDTVQGAHPVKPDLLLVDGGPVEQNDVKVFGACQKRSGRRSNDKSSCRLN